MKPKALNRRCCCVDKHNSWTIVCFWFALVVTKPLPSSLLSGTARSTTGIRDNFIVSIFRFHDAGDYYLRLEHTHSATFTIARGVLMQRTFSDVLHYFKSQRCSGQFDQQDKQVPLLSTSTTADVHGAGTTLQVTLASISVTFLTLTI